MDNPNKFHELLISETSVPDIFIARYMPMLSRDGISLYLWIRMTHKAGIFSKKQALSFGIIPELSVDEALAELVSCGVIVRKEDDKFEFVDIKRIEVDEYLEHKTDEAGIPLLKSDEKRRNLLADSIQKTFYQGYMPYAFYKLVDKCLYELRFEDSVVYSLFEEGRELRIHYIVPKMYDLASSWSDKGYTTADSLKDYYELRKRRDGVSKLTGKLLRKHLTELDYERINKWIEVYDASEELVEYAIRQNEWRTSIRTIDIENKLKEWFDAGIKTADKALVYEEEQKKENKSRASRGRSRTNVRRSGREAGITVEKEISREKLQNAAEAPKPEHDSILDMFAEDDDENDS